MSKVQVSRKASVKSNTSSAEVSSTSSNSKILTDTFPLTLFNYKLIGIGIGILIIGYFLMSIEGFIDAKHFSIALYVAPFIIVAGYIQIIYAVLARPKSIYPHQYSNDTDNTSVNEDN